MSERSAEGEWRQFLDGSFPSEFIDETEALLLTYEDEAFLTAFFRSLAGPRAARSLRFNSLRLRADAEEAARRGETASPPKETDAWDAAEAYAADFFAKEKIPLRRVPWAKAAYYYPDSRRLSERSAYLAGLYYIQEASAMLPAELLAPARGSRVLDMCAAPGGKSLRLAEAIGFEGSLVSNDYSRSRAKVLRHNLRQLGLRNSLVLSADPRDLCETEAQGFDALILDAPCSGEGMMRKSAEARRARATYPVEDLVQLQAALLDTAARLLKVGGKMVYSTCTFNSRENEGQILRFLRRHPEFRLCEPSFSEEAERFLTKGFPLDGEEQLRRCRRIFPHCAEGEGHFAALLEKAEIAAGERRSISVSGGLSFGAESEKPAERGRASLRGGPSRRREKTARASAGAELSLEEAKRAFADFAVRNLCAAAYEPFLEETEGDFALLEQTLIWRRRREPLRSAAKIHLLYTGLSFGEVKKDRRGGVRFIPNHELSAMLPPRAFRARAALSGEISLLFRYVQGQTFHADELAEVTEGDCEAEYLLVTEEGHGIGLMKRQGGILKNLYPSTLQGRAKAPGSVNKERGEREDEEMGLGDCERE